MGRGEKVGGGCGGRSLAAAPPGEVCTAYERKAPHLYSNSSLPIPKGGCQIVLHDPTLARGN